MKCIWTEGWECILQRAIFKRWRLLQAGGIFSLLRNSRFSDQSQHLCSRSHRSRGREGTMCPGLWHGAVRGAASTLHPSMLAAPSIIHTLQCARGFRTHYQNRDYFLKHDAPATATTHQSTPGGCRRQPFRTTVGSPLGPRLWWLFSSTFDCFLGFLGFFFTVYLSFLHLRLMQLFTDVAQRQTCTRDKNHPQPSPEPYLTIKAVSSLLHNLVSMFPEFPCVLIIFLL